jgi:hypothetical protein
LLTAVVSLLLSLATPIAHAETQPVAPADYNSPDPERAAPTYVRAAANVALVNWTVWQIAWLGDKDWVPVTRDSLRANLESGFEFDQDILQTNFFGHPYHGSLQFNGARATGLSFWESSLYTFAGSVTWELFAEREKPSLNDLFVTALGGIMLGEITHRLSSELLDERRRGGRRLLSELLGAMVDPLRGFERFTTRSAWREGSPPKRHPLRFELELGVDRVSLTEQDGQLVGTRPALLFAADVHYGDLLPTPGRVGFEPFDFFELYAAANLLNSELSGAHVYSSALLSGVSLTLSRRGARVRDNDVFGFAMNYEYVGTNFTTYSGVGAGPVNKLVLRLDGRKRLTVSAGIDLVPILGATSTRVGDTERDYNISAGFSPWSALDLRMGRFGELGLRLRHYVAKVVNGEPGEEAIGSMRVWFELPLFQGFGLGLAPTLVYRRGHYRDQPSYSAQQFSTQIYAISNL